jgi:hypothetical protein
MKKFGIVKSKFLNKLTEAYSNDKKAEVKELLNVIKENADFKQLYLYYEEVEGKYFEDKEIAKLYVESVSNLSNQQYNPKREKEFNLFCENLDKQLGDIEIGKNEIYESLDALMQPDSLSNIEKKAIAKKSLYEHLITKKEVKKSEATPLVTNESLLNAVLANNFNVLYANTLNEEQKEMLKNILNLDVNEIESKTKELKESILSQVDTLMTESNDLDLKNKLDDVKNEVNSLQPSRYNYYRLHELKNGLN